MRRDGLIGCWRLVALYLRAALRFPVAVCLLTTVAVPAGAATVHVPLDAPTIEAALALAAPNDTVQVADGTYLERDLLIDQALVVRGNPQAPHQVVVDAQLLGRHFRVAGVNGAVSLEGLSLVNGAPGDGASTAVVGTSSFALRHCVLRGNRAAAALLFDECGDVIVSDSWFEDNLPAVIVDSFSDSSRYERCVFFDNAQPLTWVFTTALVSNCTFVGNRLRDMGGGTGVMASEHASVTIESSVVAFNEVPAFSICTSFPTTFEFRASCSLFFGNDDQAQVGCYPETPAIVSYDRCLTLDPCICDRAAGDFRLSEGSPSAGSTECAQPMGAFGVGCSRSECAGVPAPPTSFGRLKARF